MTRIVNQDPHGLPLALSTGALIAPGESAKADPKDPHDQALLDSGACAPADTVADLRKVAADLGVEKRGAMSRDELEAAIATAELAAAAAATTNDEETPGA